MPIRIMNLWMLQIFLEIHPLAGRNFPFAIGDFACYWCQWYDNIQIGTAKAKIRTAQSMPQADKSIEFGYDAGLLLHLTNDSINEILVWKGIRIGNFILLFFKWGVDLEIC